MIDLSNIPRNNKQLEYKSVKECVKNINTDTILNVSECVINDRLKNNKPLPNKFSNDIYKIKYKNEVIK